MEVQDRPELSVDMFYSLLVNSFTSEGKIALKNLLN